jgi:hypothetical protein
MRKSTYIKLQQKCHFDDVDIRFKMLLRTISLFDDVDINFYNAKT